MHISIAMIEGEADLVKQGTSGSLYSIKSRNLCLSRSSRSLMFDQEIYSMGVLHTPL